MGYMQSAKYDSGREEIVLVNDQSGTMECDDWNPSRLEGAAEANQELIEVKASRFPQDRVGVVAYNDYATLIHPLVRAGDNQDELVQSLRSMKAGGRTNITAGLALAERLLFGESSVAEVGQNILGSLSQFIFGDTASQVARENEDEAETGVVKRIVILTDGHQNEGPKPVRPARSLKDRGVVIDCIGIGGYPSAVNEDDLKKIASRGPDGSIRYWFIGDKGQLIQKYRDLSRHIRPA